MDEKRENAGETAHQRPLDVRRAGVLLHVTSLPSAGAERGDPRPGDLGPEAYRFVDFLAAAGCTVWQVLPLVPTHEADRSPYNALSAMAGNPELISRELRGRARPDRPDELTRTTAAVDFDDVVRAAAATGSSHTSSSWRCATLLDHAPWPTWEPRLRDRDPQRVAEVARTAGPVQALRFEQWVFATQWAELRAYAADKGVLHLRRPADLRLPRQCGRLGVP